MKELPKVYDPKQVESKIYDMWMRGGYFAGKPDPDKKPFSIVMPPPNVTGQLHMGHALDATLQDILTRYKRMQGYAALWVPGTDHAGIATQIKVEEMSPLRKTIGIQTAGNQRQFATHRKNKTTKCLSDHRICPPTLLPQQARVYIFE